MSKKIWTEWDRLRTKGGGASKGEILKFLVYVGKIKTEKLAEEIAEYVISSIGDDVPKFVWKPSTPADYIGGYRPLQNR